MKKILEQSFFNRPVSIVAQDLIGKYLIRKQQTKRLSLQITEVEIYDEQIIKTTAKNGLYLIDSTCWGLNIKTTKHSFVILIKKAGHISSPNELTKKLNLDETFNNKKIHPESFLWIEDRNVESYQKVLHKYQESALNIPLKSGLQI